MGHKAEWLGQAMFWKFKEESGHFNSTGSERAPDMGQVGPGPRVIDRPHTDRGVSHIQRQRDRSFSDENLQMAPFPLTAALDPA